MFLNQRQVSSIDRVVEELSTLFLQNSELFFRETECLLKGFFSRNDKCLCHIFFHKDKSHFRENFFIFAAESYES